MSTWPLLNRDGVGFGSSCIDARPWNFDEKHAQLLRLEGPEEARCQTLDQHGSRSSSAFRTMPMIWRQGAHTVPLTGLPLLRCCLPLPSRRWSYRLDRSVHRRGVREQHVPKDFIVYSSDEEEVTARLLQWSHRTDATRTRAQRTSPHKWSCCGEGVPRPPRAFSGRLRGRTLSTTPPTTSKPVDQVNASS